VRGGVAAVAIAPLLGGCLVLPETRTSEHIVSRHQTGQQFGPTKAMELEIRADGPMIRVRAISPRMCTNESYAIVDVTRSKGATLDAPPGSGADPLGLALIVSLVTLPVSALITAVVLATSSDTTTRERKVLKANVTHCPIYGANLRVTYAMPSGLVIEKVTDVYGGATEHVPPDEPESGVVVVRVGDVAGRSVTYIRDPEAAARKAIEDCQRNRREALLHAQTLTDIHARTRALQNLPRCDEPASD